ncbi:MAG: hypothetical protein JSS87_13820 [Acidobacteria bacterium]|nr:hypothetical protein [Acidobacteriota bacterium]
MLRTARFASFALVLSVTCTTGYAQNKVPKDHSVTDTKKNNDEPIAKSAIHNPVLWHDPGDIASKDLYYGQGGSDTLPKPPFIFLDEDKGGTSPKLDLRDANGKKWHIKVSEESQPEVVASRLLWAVGFYANDDYCIAEAQVNGMKMSRGNSDVKRGHLINARFSHKPEHQKKIATWEWGDNPFKGTREFNGLRVMMAVINNWDLKDVNNSVYYDKDTNKQIFLVNDIGATFGTNGVSWTKSRSKGNLESFKDSKFIQKLSETEVSFATPHAPTGMTILTLGATAKSYAMRNGLDWIGNNIPRADARWMGSLLGQLTHQQLMDAFRAGNFPPDVAVQYVMLIENRIHELKDL